MKYFLSYSTQEVSTGNGEDIIETPVVIPAISELIANIIATSMGASKVTEIIPTLAAIENNVECNCTDKQHMQLPDSHSIGCPIHTLALQIGVQ